MFMMTLWAIEGGTLFRTQKNSILFRHFALSASSDFLIVKK